MALKIYTKTGDAGKTSLIGGTKVFKSHMRIDAYGTVDELNAHIGLLGDLLAGFNVASLLKEIQDRLFTVGSSLACDPEKETMLKIPDLREEDLGVLEQAIDQMNEELPPLTSFVLPGGHTTVSSIHIARCVCRRAERLCVNLVQHDMYVAPLVIKYLNRLSDYLFVLSRYAAHLLQVQEVAWKPRV